MPLCRGMDMGKAEKVLKELGNQCYRVAGAVPENWGPNVGGAR
jgi:hypothetical protein